MLAQVEEEKKNPGSQEREALGKLPQMWGQSLYVLASLVKEVSGICDSQTCWYDAMHMSLLAINVHCLLH